MMGYRQILAHRLLLGLLVLRQVLCYPEGAPPEACSNMLPSHGASPSNTLPPYTITTSKSTYKPNEQITVTLQANSGQSFKGFLLQARKKNTINQPNTIGTLTVNSSTYNPCTGLAALTQSSGNSRSTLSVTWKAPAVADGNVVFVATFVKVKTTYWINVQSQEIIPDTSAPATNATNAPATNAPVTNSSVGGGGTSTAPPGGVTMASSAGGTTMPSMVSLSISTALPGGVNTASSSQGTTVSSTISLPISTALPGGVNTASSSQGTTVSSTVSLPISTALPGGVNTASSSEGTTVPSMGGNTVQCLDPACGKTKGCFHDCDLGDDWTFLVTWADKGGNSIYFEMKAKIPASNNYWMSVGFSSDTEMGQDSVADCSLESGIVKAYSSYNPGKSNELLDSPSYGVTGMGGKLENGVFTCSFSRIKTATLVSSGRRKKRATSSSATFFDLNQNWYLMFALGSGSAASKSQHSTPPKVSQKKADLQSMEDLTSAANLSLVKALLCIMSVLLSGGTLQIL